MVEKEKAEEIMAKYNRNFGTFTKNATRKEFKTVLKYVAEEANRKQRKLVGLDSKNVKILIKSLKFGSPIKLQILGRIFLMRLLMRGGFKFFQVYSLAKIPD